MEVCGTKVLSPSSLFITRVANATRRNVIMGAGLGNFSDQWTGGINHH